MSVVETRSLHHFHSLAHEVLGIVAGSVHGWDGPLEELWRGAG